MEVNKFSSIVRKLLDEVDQTQQKNIELASKLIYESMKKGGIFHVFCTGHSHMIAEEFFYRAGGLIPVNPLLMPFLMQHEGAVSSTKFERLSGVAKIVFDGADIRKGEPILIASNSGINAVPIEMAMLAKENGNPVITLTSANVSAQVQSRHASGKRLFELGDIVLDTNVPKGDSVIDCKNGLKTGSVSSIVSLYIVQKLAINITNTFVENGEDPPIFKSANVAGGDEYNEKLLKKYKGRIRCLY